MRTTLDLDPVVLEELKRRRAVEGRSLGAIASELLRHALAGQPHGQAGLMWASQPLGIQVDLGHKAALWRALDDG